MCTRDGIRLFEGKSQGTVGGGFPFDVRLVYPRRERLERQPESCQQLAPVRGGGGEDQGGHDALRAMRIAFRKQ